MNNPTPQHGGARKNAGRPPVLKEPRLLVKMRFDEDDLNRLQTEATKRKLTVRDLVMAFARSLPKARYRYDPRDPHGANPKSV